MKDSLLAAPAERLYSCFLALACPATDQKEEPQSPIHLRPPLGSNPTILTYLLFMAFMATPFLLF